MGPRVIGLMFLALVSSISSARADTVPEAISKSDAAEVRELAVSFHQLVETVLSSKGDCRKVATAIETHVKSPLDRRADLLLKLSELSDSAAQQWLTTNVIEPLAVDLKRVDGKIWKKCTEQDVAVYRAAESHRMLTRLIPVSPPSPPKPRVPAGVSAALAKDAAAGADGFEKLVFALTLAGTCEKGTAYIKADTTKETKRLFGVRKKLLAMKKNGGRAWYAETFKRQYGPFPRAMNDLLDECKTDRTFVAAIEKHPFLGSMKVFAER